MNWRSPVPRPGAASSKPSEWMPTGCPIPTLGVKVGSERDGQERIVGFQVSIPLPGEARAASARAGSAQAHAAGAREALVLTRVETEARRTISQAQSTHAQWQRLSDVAALMENNARLLEKAWRLGEGQFADLQTARRQAIESRLAAVQSRLEANEARYRLLLDAHELWDFEEAGARRRRGALSRRAARADFPDQSQNSSRRPRMSASVHRAAAAWMLDALPQWLDVELAADLGAVGAPRRHLRNSTVSMPAAAWASRQALP